MQRPQNGNKLGRFKEQKDSVANMLGNNNQRAWVEQRKMRLKGQQKEHKAPCRTRKGSDFF